MSKDIKTLLTQKLALNNQRHLQAQQDIELNIGKKLIQLPLDKIQTNPFQPRFEFDEHALQKLAESIKEVGLLQPISVREVGHDKYQIVAGERRYQACKLLGKSTIDALITQTEDSELAILALAENIDRQDLSDFEIGQALRKIESLFPNKKRLAEAIGLNRSDMYRYFAFEILPTVLLDKLTLKPRLLSRMAMAQIKQTLQELDLSAVEKETILLKAWDLLESGKLEQSKMANYIRQQVHSQSKIYSTSLIKPILFNGKSVGKIQHKGKNLVIEIDNSVLKEQQEQEIELFLNQLINKFN